MRIKIASVALAALIVSSPAFAGTTPTKAKSTLTKSSATKAKSTKSSKASTPAKATKAVKPVVAAAKPAAANPAPDGTLLGGCNAALLGAANCQGYYSGNVLSGNSTDIAIQQSAIAALPGDFQFDGNWGALAGDTITALVNGNQLDFGTALFGETYIGIHFGNVSGEEFGNVTGFYYFNFLTPTNSITLYDTQGFSTATLYGTGTAPDGGTGGTGGGAVPEPSTWAMMLLGFGAVGAGMRRRRRAGNVLTQIA